MVNLYNKPVYSNNSEITPYLVRSLQLKSEYSDIDLTYFLECYYNPVAFIQGEITVVIMPIFLSMQKYCLWFYYSIQSFCWGYIIYNYILF